MNNEPLKPMDVYGDMTIPFDIAAYCRGHKYSQEAVDLARAIRRRAEMREAVAKAERELQNAESIVSLTIDKARRRMDGDAHA
jgi:hypothetical protein